MITWRFPLSAYCCIPLQICFEYVSQPKALINNKGYKLIITINIHMKKTGRQLKGNIGKYTAWEKRAVGQCTKPCCVILIKLYDVHKGKLKRCTSHTVCNSFPYFIQVINAIYPNFHL